MQIYIKKKAQAKQITTNTHKKNPPPDLDTLWNHKNPVRPQNYLMMHYMGETPELPNDELHGLPQS